LEWFFSEKKIEKFWKEFLERRKKRIELKVIELKMTVNESFIRLMTVNKGFFETFEYVMY